MGVHRRMYRNGGNNVSFEPKPKANESDSVEVVFVEKIAEIKNEATVSSNEREKHGNLRQHLLMFDGNQTAQGYNIVSAKIRYTLVSSFTMAAFALKQEEKS